MMMPSVSRFRSPILACVLAVACSPACLAADEDVIENRQRLMRIISEQSGAMGQIMATLIPEDKAIEHIETMALTAAASLRAFESKVPGGDSRDEVWGDWEDFSARLKQLAEGSAQALEVARTQGAQAGLATAALAMECKGCHERYRKD